MIRRPLAALLALIILASSFGGLASAARAQQPTIDNLGNLNDSFTPSGPSGFLPSTIVPSADSAAPTSPPPSAEPQKDTTAEKKPISPPAPATTPPEDVYGSVMVQIMGLFAMLLGIAVVTLDNAVYYTVVDMGKYLKNLSAIGVSWRILRDIGNVVLIFGFLVIGISIILDLNIYGYGTKMLPTLLIAAVFLNFSLFISEAVIDAGNLFATQFYTQINGGDPPAPVSYANAQGVGISNRIMGQLGLSGIYADALHNDPQHHLLGNGTPWYVGFLGILLFLIAAFVIFSLAFILIARFVILVFLIIVAPIGFAGLAVPKLEKSAHDWWGQLFEQTITAPILLLMLYVALAVITDANFLTGLAAPGAKAQWTGFLSGNTDGFAALLLSFLVAMGLLLAVTVLAKRLGAFGADWAMKWGGRMSFGLAALGTGAVVGGSAFGLRKGLQRVAPNSRFTRLASRGLRFVERRRMDVRAVPGIGAALEFGGAGEAAKPIAKGAIGRVRQGIEFMQKSAQESDRAYQQETVIPRLNAAVNTALRTGDYRPVSTILSSMSDKDFEGGAAQRALVRSPIAASLLSQARFDKIQQSEAISEARKAEIAVARRNGDDPAHALSRFNMNPAMVFPATLPSGAPHPYAGRTRGEALIQGMNTSARGRLGGNVLTINTAPAGAPPIYAPRNAALDLLNGADFDAIRRTGELAPGQQTAIGNYILGIITTPHAPGAVVTPREASIASAAGTPAFRAYYNLP